MTSVQVQYGGREGRAFTLETNEDLVVVRTHDRAPAREAALSARGMRALDALEPLVRFPEAGVEVFHVRDGSQGTRDEVRATLKSERAVRFAGRVLGDAVFKPGVPAAAPRAARTLKEPVLYSENLFVKFDSARASSAAKKILASFDLKVKREIEYLANAFYVKAREGIGLEVFDMALQLLRKVPEVQLCHPELLRRREFRGAFPDQWHLKPTRHKGELIDAGANVVEAWRHGKGKGIVIAVIDDGVDIDHEEFASRGKIVHPRDATEGALEVDNPRPQRSRDAHGTACAGVACADGLKGASGVAPEAKLMPIRLDAGLGSQAEADAIAWAADQGADVISCSWGPPDGVWWDPSDPHHRAEVALPDSTRLAIDHAATRGRGGKGCVICFAAGNGNESADLDGYIAYEKVIAVAACNDTGTRSVYSDTGNAIWCAFPSNDYELEAMARPRPPLPGGVFGPAHPGPKTPGIWTVDRIGAAGYNRGGPHSRTGDPQGHYCNNFGGTSSATPGVAGVAALILGVNPDLTYADVRDILKRSCVKIDAANGQYDARTGHSPWYGYGRVDAGAAVMIAKRTVASTSAVKPARAKAARRGAHKR